MADRTEAQLLGSGKASCRFGAFATQSITLTPSGITLQQLQALFSSVSRNFLSFGGSSLVKTQVTLPNLVTETDKFLMPHGITLLVISAFLPEPELPTDSKCFPIQRV